jgi:integrase
MAVGWGWITANPAKGTHRPPIRRRPIVPPTVEQLVRLIRAAAAEDESMAIVFEVASGVGGRRGELCGLRWRDIDWADGTVLVHQAVKQLTKDDGGVEVSGTKTHQHRKVDLPSFVVEILRRHRVEVEDRAAWAGTTLHPRAFVFSREPDGSLPLWPNWVTAAFERARRKSGLDDEREREGLPPVRLHDLRHLYATLQLAKGIPVEVVASLLGHAQISTTHNIYAHALPGSGKQAAQIIDELLGQRPDRPRAIEP